MSESTPLINMIRQDMGVELPPAASYEEIRNKLAVHLSLLINSDFNQLVSLLYRIDISENKLKTVLKDNPEQDAALMIADLIIERQLQKIESRNKFSANDIIPEDEKW